MDIHTEVVIVTGAFYLFQLICGVGHARHSALAYTDVCMSAKTMRRYTLASVYLTGAAAVAAAAACHMLLESGFVQEVSHTLI